MLICRSADQLKADGQSGGRETTRDGDGGDAGEICGAVVAKQERASGMITFVQARGFFVDERSGDRGGGNDKSVDASVYQRQVELLDELAAQF